MEEAFKIMSYLFFAFYIKECLSFFTIDEGRAVSESPH
jgi:hypothetical protein